MNDQNCIILVGHVIYEAKNKLITNNREFAWFTIIVNEDSNIDGIRIERHNYFKVLLFGKMAAYAEWLTKGRFISIQGRLRQNEWKHNDEIKREVVVVCEYLQFLEKKEKEIF
jgi:single-stranded DNA-binding protein